MRLFTDDLADMSLFSDASRAEVASVRQCLTKVPVPAGRVLVHEGTPGDQFMIIAAGKATVSQGGRTIATLGRGDLVGEMALLVRSGIGCRNATVTAQTDATVYAGTRAEFRSMLDASPSVAQKVRQTAAARAA